MRKKSIDGQGLKLVVDKTKVKSATVAVAFCIDKKMMQKIGIEEIGNELIYVFIEVTSEKGTKKRYAVPLKKMYIHLPMIGSGVNRIEYSLLKIAFYNTDEGKKRIKNRVEVFMVDGHLDYIEKYSEGMLEITMPEEYFDKDTWLKKKACELLKSKPVNGCKARMEVIKAVPVLVVSGAVYLLMGLLIGVYGLFMLLASILLPIVGLKVDLKDFFSDVVVHFVPYSPNEYISKWFSFWLSPLMVAGYSSILYMVSSILEDLEINLGDVFLFLTIVGLLYMAVKYVGEYIKYRRRVAADKIYELQQTDEYREAKEQEQVILLREKRKALKKAKKAKGAERKKMMEKLECAGSGDIVNIPEPEVGFLERKGVCLPVSY